MKHSKSKNIYKLVLLSLTMMCSLGFSSCAKKGTGVRSAPKTSATVVSPQSTAQAQQAAVSQNLSYTLEKIGWPEVNPDGSISMSFELKNPQSQFLPITTSHFTNQDAYGVYNDSINGVQLDIRTRCLGEGCEKYYTLVTIVKNNYAYHQIASLSYNTDCDFNVEHRNYQTAQLFNNLDEVVNRFGSIPKKLDCAGE